MSELDAEFLGSPDELTERDALGEAGHQANLPRRLEAPSVRVPEDSAQHER